MRYDLAQLARRQRPGLRRRSIILREIATPATMATDLYRAAYLPIVQAWTAALPRIEAEYERTLSTMTQDSPADVQAEVDGAAEQISRLVLLLTPEVRTWALRVERFVRSKWRGAVLSATSVDLEMLIGPEDVRETLDNVIAWNTNLIADVSAQAKQRIGNAVFDGLRNRTAAREVAAKVREAVGMSRRRSVAIASDQLSKLTGALADERRREAGISAWEWVHSRKAHPRTDHVQRNGLIYSDDPEQVGGTINGKPIGKPPEDRPSQLPWCGCRSRSVVVFD